MKKIFLITFLVLATLPGSAQIAVVDAASIRQQIQQLLQMQKQLVQLQQMFALYQQQFNLLQSEYQQLRGLPNRYRYTFSNWQQFAVGNQYGNTPEWANALNTGSTSSVQQGYRKLVSTVTPAKVNITPQAKSEWEQQYGLLELQDATIMQGMKSTGDIRTNIAQSLQAIQQLEADSTSTDPALQSSKALQQKTLIANLILLRTLQDTNRLLSASLEMQMQTLAQQRWERGRALNQAAQNIGK